MVLCPTNNADKKPWQGLRREYPEWWGILFLWSSLDTQWTGRLNMLLWPVYSIMPFTSSSNTNDFLVVSSSNVVTSAQNPQDTWRRWTSFVDKNLMSSSFCANLKKVIILTSVSLFWLRKWGLKYDRNGKIKKYVSFKIMQ